jgi:hypothetical protein
MEQRTPQPGACCHGHTQSDAHTVPCGPQPLFTMAPANIWLSPFELAKWAPRGHPSGEWPDQVSRPHKALSACLKPLILEKHCVFGLRSVSQAMGTLEWHLLCVLRVAPSLSPHAHQHGPLRHGLQAFCQTTPPTPSFQAEHPPSTQPRLCPACSFICSSSGTSHPPLLFHIYSRCYSMHAFLVLTTQKTTNNARIMDLEFHCPGPSCCTARRDRRGLSGVRVWNP